jgi:hypothetical protein
MAKHREHPHKASSWRDGKLVVHPDAAAEDCTVWFASAPDEGGEIEWEGLLARRLAEDRARICAVPIWAYDVNLGDEVKVIESGDGAPVAENVVLDAGNFTFRVVFEPATSDDDTRWHDLMIGLEQYDCWFDMASRRLLAISAPPHHAQAVADYLALRQARGDLQYETGRSEQPGADAR